MAAKVMARIMSTPHLAEQFHGGGKKTVKMPYPPEVAKSDWVRAGRFLRGEWPRQLPSIYEWQVDLTQYEQLYRAPYLVIDTEFNLDNKHMWLLGIGGPGTDIIQWWPDRASSETRMVVRQTLRELIATRPIVYQNAMADIPIIEHALGLGYEDYKQVDDLLFVHSLLWCELPHTLEFIASVSGWYEKLKHLPMSDPRYNAGDVAETIAGWEQASKEMGRDPQTEWVYRECMLPLIPIILEAQSLGLRVDRPAVERARGLYEANRSWATQVGAAYAGFPLNLGSQGADGQVGRFLTYDLKHWLPKPPKITSVDEDAIAEMRGSILPFDPQEEVTTETVARRIAQGGHPILESRVLYARAQQYLSHYVEPMLSSSDGRVYAHFHPWTQNTGRWSTVDPPLAQLPASLRDALLPDAGWRWYEFDWGQIELRLIAALANDIPLLETFAKEWDLHTVHMCQFFGYLLPPNPTKGGLKGAIEWASSIGFQGGDDPRRVFAKQAVFRLCYGGTPEGAPSIPGAMTLGLPPAQIVAASKRWINAHPAIKRFWRQIEQQALTKRQLRTFLGRRWNFLGTDRKRILRQMYDFPMQGGVADIMNLTLIRIKRALGERVRLSYTMHDSIKLQVKETEQVEADKQVIRDIAQAEWDVGRVKMQFPAEFKERRAA